MSAVVETVATTRGPYNDYSPEFKAEVLAAVKANEGNVLRTATQYDISEGTVRFWVQSAERFREFRERKQEDLALKIEYNAHKLADSIANHDLSEVPLGQKATAMGIMIDKMQLLRGQPTSITESIDRAELSIILSDALSDAIDVTPQD